MVCGLPTAVASLVAEHGLSACGVRAQCPTASGIFPDQALNPRPLHGKAVTKLSNHRGRPPCVLFIAFNIFSVFQFFQCNYYVSQHVPPWLILDGTVYF